MPPISTDMYVVAGASREGQFPPGLNTADPPTELRADETPDGYGYDLSQDGRIATGTIPSGTSRIQRSVVLNGITYYWHYRRLWGMDGNDLRVGALDYDDVWHPQRFGKIDFAEDTQDIIAITPFQPDQLCVTKSTGSYILGNCSDGRAYFTRSDIVQELAVASASRIAEVDNTIVASNATGLIGYRGGETIEYTRKVRDDLTNFINQDLTVDYAKKRIIGGTSFVYELATEKLFYYNGSNFRFTSRAFHLPDYAPIAIDRVLFLVEHGDGDDDGTLTYQTKFEDEEWGNEFDVRLVRTSEQYTLIPEQLLNMRTTHRFQIRITALSSNKYIREIRLDQEAFQPDAYTT